MSPVVPPVGPDFEQRVRFVARALWHLPAGGGAAESYGTNQIDCVCRTEDIVHLVECTTDRSLQKVIKQIEKLLNAQRDEQRRGNTAKLWIVTFFEPTSEQRTVARKDTVTILSLEQFESRLLQAEAYLNLRWKYPFGSATDPDSDGPILPDDEYVPLPLTDVGSGHSFDVDSVADLLEKSGKVLLTGPYGAGKSLTLREIFKRLRGRWFNRESGVIPVALNLRDHWGQPDVDEALRRHAAKIGFEHPDQLVRAWNAGRLVILLDGFDELAAQTVRVGPEATKRARRDALRLVRAFTRHTAVGVLVTGRDHYFDRDAEMFASLGVSPGATVLEVGEFTEEQAAVYLRRKRRPDAQLPTWLPRKPLLLGYVAAQKLLDKVLAIDGAHGPAYAWDQFLDRICVRDAAMADDIEPAAVRKILEHLATRTRESASGSGPLYDADLAGAYRAVTSFEPLENSMVLLQRLPGLTAREQEMGARSFVDPEMTDALRAGAVASFIVNPFVSIGREPFRHCLSEFGCSVVALLTERAGVVEGQYRVAAQQAYGRWGQPTLAMDCLISGALRMQEAGIGCNGLEIAEAYIDVLDLDEVRFDGLAMESCAIETLRLGELGSTGLSMRKCLFGRVEGVSSMRGLPEWIAEASVDTFDDAHTNAAILKLDLPVPVRVLLTIIRKLFVQKGSGRKESALHRGLDGASERFELLSRVVD